ncbi:MAG: mechanosensitive ion channel, partial [Butyrivibrio sp.]|nr:mechanosensitive ion channel [Butyrivibrio sp.]
MQNFSIAPNESELSKILDNLTSKDIVPIVIIAIITFLLTAAVYILLTYFILKLNKAIFKRIEKKRGNSITLQFLQKAVALLLIAVLVVLPLGGKQLARSLLGSTAVLAVIVGLAANEVLKDMFAGLEISIYKPFDIGSRIMLEDGRAGIVEKLTLRHVVLKLIDTTRV